jgi:hypothetical protein
MIILYALPYVMHSLSMDYFAKKIYTKSITGVKLPQLIKINPKYLLSTFSTINLSN